MGFADVVRVRERDDRIGIGEAIVLAHFGELLSVGTLIEPVTSPSGIGCRSRSCVSMSPSESMTRTVFASAA